MTYQEFLKIAPTLDDKNITVVHNGLMANGVYHYSKNGTCGSLIELTNVEFFKNGYPTDFPNPCNNYSIFIEDIDEIIIE